MLLLTELTSAPAGKSIGIKYCQKNKWKKHLWYPYRCTR